MFRKHPQPAHLTSGELGDVKKKGFDKEKIVCDGITRLVIGNRESVTVAIASLLTVWCGWTKMGKRFQKEGHETQTSEHKDCG